MFKDQKDKPEWASEKDLETQYRKYMECRKDATSSQDSEAPGCNDSQESLKTRFRRKKAEIVDKMNVAGLPFAT